MEFPLNEVPWPFGKPQIACSFMKLVKQERKNCTALCKEQFYYFGNGQAKLFLALTAEETIRSCDFFPDI